MERGGSVVVSVLDSGAEGSGFKSQPRRCRATVVGKCAMGTFTFSNITGPSVCLSVCPIHRQQPRRLRGLLLSARRDRARAAGAVLHAPALSSKRGQRLVNNRTPTDGGCSTGSLLCYRERKCADTIGTVPITWAGHFQR